MYLLSSYMQKLEEFNFLIGWKVGYSAGMVWVKGGGGFGRKWGWIWVINGSVLGKCQDGFGSGLQ